MIRRIEIEQLIDWFFRREEEVMRYIYFYSEESKLIHMFNRSENLMT